MPPELTFDLSTIDLNRVVCGKEEIRQILPQRFEFEQLDAVVHVSVSENIVVGYKDVRSDEFWVRGHLPNYPLFPGVLMCEAAAQLCSFFAVKYHMPPGTFIGFGGMENVRFRGTVHPGDRFVLVGKASKISRRRMLFAVQGFVGNKMVFHADVMGLPLSRPDALQEAQSGSEASA
jgi:3-hydroxyacyl-[acyl-carrier-protein] dehydratase